MAAVVAVSDLRILFPSVTEIVFFNDLISFVSFSETPPSGPIKIANFLNLFLNLEI